MNGKKWRSRILAQYAKLIEDYGVPEIPIFFVRNYDFFIVNDWTTAGHFFVPTTERGEPTFYIPFDPNGPRRELEAMTGRVISRSGHAPEITMSHEFYHYLEFLSYGPSEAIATEYRRKQAANDYHSMQSEIDAEDFAKAYEL